MSHSSSPQQITTAPLYSWEPDPLGGITVYVWIYGAEKSGPIRRTLTREQVDEVIKGPWTTLDDGFAALLVARSILAER